MNRGNGLTKMFRTPSGRYYVYDGMTNRIFTVADSLVKAAGQEPTGNVTAYLKKQGLMSEDAFEKVIWQYPYETYLNMIERQLSSMLLQLTCRCNLDCAYCVYSGKYTHMQPHRNADMTWETAKKSLDFFIAHNVDYDSASIDFYGGEPLLCFDLMKRIVDYASGKLQGKKLQFRFTTNGVLLREPVAKWMQEHPQVLATITVNGPYHDAYRKTVSGAGSLEKIMENLHRIRNDYPAVWENQIRFISNAVNVGQVKPICRFFRCSIEKPPLSITHVREQDGNQEITQMLQYEAEQEADALREEYCQTQDPYLGAYFERGIASVKNRRVFKENVPGYIGSCLPLLEKLYVQYDGKIGICETTCDKAVIGDVYNGYDYTLLKEIYEQGESLYNRQCRECWAQRLCTVCFKDVISDQGKMNTHITEGFCKASREYVLDQLVLYCEIYGKSK